MPILLFMIVFITFSVEQCSMNHHKRQDLILPENGFFINTSSQDPEIYFQTFFNQEDANFAFFWKSGRILDLNVVIRNGNDLYDYSGNFVGYIIVNKDGSFDVKGSDLVNGHYVGEYGETISYSEQEQSGDKNTDRTKAGIEVDGNDIFAWLNGTWSAKSTPLGDISITLDDGTFQETIGNKKKSGTYELGKDYIQLTYRDGSGVRLEMDMKNERIGLGEGWWLSKNSYEAFEADDAVFLEVFFQDFPYIYEHQKEIADRNGFVFIAADNKMGLADKSGKIRLAPSYDCLELTEDGKYALVIQEDRKGLYDTNGKEILPVEYTFISSLRWESSSGGLGDYGDFVSGMDTDPYLLVQKDGKYGVTDKKGRFICNLKYKQIVWPDAPDEGIWFCEREDGIDIVEYRTQTTLQVDCERSWPSMDSYCSIRRNGKWGVVNRDGELIVDTIYDEIPNQSDRELYSLTVDGSTDLAVIKDGKYGMIDFEGNVLLPFEYDYIDTCPINGCRRLFIGEKETFEGMWGLYKEGQIVVPCSDPTSDEVNKMINSY